MLKLRVFKKAKEESKQMRLNRDRFSAMRTAVFIVVSLAVSSVGAVGHSQRRSPTPPQPAPASERDDSWVIPHGMSREVSGAMEVGEGKTKREITLKYVWAQYYKSAGVPPGAVPGGVPAGSFPENTWTLFFSDKLLPEDSGDREMFIDVLATEGKLNGLRIEIGDGALNSARAYCDICKRPDGEYYWGWCVNCGGEMGEQVFESKTLNSKSVSGTLHSSTITDNFAEGSALQYRVTFTAGLDKKPQLAKILSEADDEPGRAYVSFYNSVEAGDAAGARRLIAAEFAKLLDGPDAKQRLLRLKSLIDGLKTVGFTQVYTGNGSAQLLIKSTTAVAPSYFPRPARTQIGQPVPSPPPPPPPPSNLDTRNRGAQRKAPSRSLALVRMVFEDNQWKVFWILDGRFNMLSEGYKTPEERTALQRRSRSR